MMETIGFLELNSIALGVQAADAVLKAASVELIFVRGSLVIGGDVASVEAAVREVLRVLEDLLHFAPTEITRT